MIYTVIYKDDSDLMGALTFVSERHGKDHAWSEFVEKHASPHQNPVALMPGNHLVYFRQDISFTQVA